MAFRSVKLFALFFILFATFGLTSLLLSGQILHSYQIVSLFPSFSLPLKLSVLLLFLSLFLISLQTLYCGLFNRFVSLLFHLSVAASIFLALLFPLTCKSYSFYLYPGSFVKVNGKVVALEGVYPLKEGFYLKVFVERDGKREEGELSFNRPFSGDFGTLWFSGVDQSSPFPLFYFRLLNPNPVPLLIFFTGLLAVISGLFYTLSSLKREGRDVYEEGGEGAPEANRRAP
ncbi:hypothetical protein [Thermovibrio sp.]